MTINLDELRKTVENAGEAWADGEHIDIITPETVLALLSRLEQAEETVARVRELAEEFEKHDYPRGIHRFSVAKRIRRALDGDTRG